MPGLIQRALVGLLRHQPRTACLRPCCCFSSVHLRRINSAWSRYGGPSQAHNISTEALTSGSEGPEHVDEIATENHSNPRLTLQHIFHSQSRSKDNEIGDVLGLRTKEAQRLHQNLRKRLQQRRARYGNPLRALLKDLTDEKEHPLERIYLCLMREWKRIFESSKGQASEALRQGSSPEAKACVSIILERADLCLPIFIQDPKGRSFLVFFAICNGMEEAVLNGMMSTNAAQENGLLRNLDSPCWKWRDKFLQMFVNLQLSLGHPGKVDSAVESILKIAEWKASVETSDDQLTEASKRSMRNLQLVNSWIDIAKAYLFEAPSTPKSHDTCSPNTFDIFLALGEALFMHDKPSDVADENIFRLARLHLHHPSNPSPDLMLQLLKDRGGITISRELILHKRFRPEMKYLFDLLRFSGRFEEAAQVEQAYADVFQEQIPASRIRKVSKGLKLHITNSDAAPEVDIIRKLPSHPDATPMPQLRTGESIFAKIPAPDNDLRRKFKKILTSDNNVPLERESPDEPQARIRKYKVATDNYLNDEALHVRQVKAQRAQFEGEQQPVASRREQKPQRMNYSPMFPSLQP